MLNIKDSIVRVPFLIKGRLVIPPEISRSQIEAAFNQAGETATYIQTAGAQVVREPVIDRAAMRYTGEFVYQVMPPVTGKELIESDTVSLAEELYSLSVDDILDYLEAVLDMLTGNAGISLRTAEIYRMTSEYPVAMLEEMFTSLLTSFDREAARQMIDRELSFAGKPGIDFLNGWVEIPQKNSGIGTKTMVRAMPTRQLHITAGNAPEVPVISALRAILTKSAAVIKLPYGAILSGALVAMAAAAIPDHPISRNLSIVHWQGGDEKIENALFTPGAFDRIVVWGSPETVAAVQSRALFTKIICLNPRYGISLIGEEAFSSNLEDVAAKAAADVMIYNQKACTSSLVHYIEGTAKQAGEYAEVLCRKLSEWDVQMPNFVSPVAAGQIKRMRRGKYAGAAWHINTRNDNFSSGVAVIQNDFDILDHPACRLAIVRPVEKLEDALKYVNPYVSAAGVYPEERRLKLRDRILAGGVSSVLPLGECGRVYAGMPHDGMLVLNQMVDWKNA